MIGCYFLGGGNCGRCDDGNVILLMFSFLKIIGIYFVYVLVCFIWGLFLEGVDNGRLFIKKFFIEKEKLNFYRRRRIKIRELLVDVVGV